jgi:hypothetical protein
MRRLTRSTKYASGITLADNLYIIIVAIAIKTPGINQSSIRITQNLIPNNQYRMHNCQFSNQVRIGLKSCFVLFVDKSGRLRVDIFVHYGTPTLSAVKNPSLFQGTDFLEELIPELFAQRGRANTKVKPWERLDYYRAGGELGNAEVDSDNEKKRRKITAEDYL